MDDKELNQLRQTGSFDRYELYVMQTLGDLKVEVKSLRDEIGNLRKDFTVEMGGLKKDFAAYRQITDAEISAIKVKSGLIGAAVGFFGGIAGVIISVLLKIFL